MNRKTLWGKGLFLCDSEATELRTGVPALTKHNCTYLCVVFNIQYVSVMCKHSSNMAPIINHKKQCLNVKLTYSTCYVLVKHCCVIETGNAQYVDG